MHPDYSDPGGVAAYYRKLKVKFSANVDHFLIGRRPEEHGALGRGVRMVKDYLIFYQKITRQSYAVIHVNPSLDPKSLLRDAIFIILARWQRRKTVVFFRGWQDRCARAIENRWAWLFNSIFGQADALIVLSEDHKRVLRSWGCKKPIFHESTVIDDDALDGFDMQAVLRQRLNRKDRRILFISRLTETKGIFETIEAVRLLSSKMPGLQLVVAGDGPAMDGAKHFAAVHNVTNVRFAGYVTGEAKKRLLRDSHLLCFPTRHDEGMPNTVAESMGYGLPVVTRSVGGVKDFFQNRVHGFTTVRKDPQVFADMIETLFSDRRLYRTISLNNHSYSRSHFKASHAALRLETIYGQLHSAPSAN